jgi:hypothetical protein
MPWAGCYESQVRLPQSFGIIRPKLKGVIEQSIIPNEVTGNAPIAIPSGSWLSIFSVE